MGIFVGPSTTLRSRGPPSSQAARSTPGNANQGCHPKATGTAAGEVAVIVVETRSVQPLSSTSTSRSKGKGKEANRSPDPSKRQVARSRAASAVASAAVTDHPAAPGTRPWIGWPYSSRCTPGVPATTSQEVPATSWWGEPRRFAQGASSGRPNVDPRPR